MDEISKEVGVDLQTESLLMRAEQLTRLESDKLIDKVGSCVFSILVKIVLLHVYWVTSINFYHFLHHLCQQKGQMFLI